MLLFSRTVTLVGGPRKSMPIASELAAYVNSHSSLNVSVWSALFGAPLGTLAYTARVDSHAALADAVAGFITDNEYLDLIDKVSPLLGGPVEDQLREVIHGAPAEPAVGQIAQVVTATVAGGKLAAAMAWGIGITDHVTSTTKAPIAFCRNLYGPFGQVSWLSTVEDSAGVDAAAAALAGDASYVEALDKAGDLFEPGSGSTVLLQRVI